VTERERAVDLLRRIDRDGLFSSIVLANEPGFVRALVLGVLRWRSRLDFAIEKLSHRRLARLDPIVVEILRIGLFQLQFMDIATYAAVSETVDLAARRAKRAKGLVNAVLRSATRGIPEPPDDATRLAHPAWLFERWRKQYGGERALKIAEANQELSYPDALVLEGPPPAASQPSTLVEGMVRLAGSTSELDRETIYPMDEGSAVIAAIAANSGREVLDLAAAPGGKTLYMASRGARVISSDVSLTRLRPLIGRSRTLVVVADGRQPAFRRRFEAVLLDAPCSATGTIRKNPELKWRLREAELAGFAALQGQLLESALDLTATRCIYATCSLERDENDDVVAAVLRSKRGFEVEDIGRYVPRGAASWVEEGVLRLTPDSGADGFTAFVLRRSG
jgi:16S rRNA (cytosine967-C5)-methyltransferase